MDALTRAFLSSDMNNIVLKNKSQTLYNNFVQRRGGKKESNGKPRKQQGNKLNAHGNMKLPSCKDFQNRTQLL